MYMISYDYDIIQHVIWYHSPLYDIMYMISYWGHMISYVYDIIYMISYENTYDIICHDIRYHMYMISYLMYTISCIWYHVYGAMISWVSMYDIICIIEPNATSSMSSAATSYMIEEVAAKMRSTSSTRSRNRFRPEYRYTHVASTHIATKITPRRHRPVD